MRADPRASVAAICSRARSLRTGWLLKAVSSGGWLIISRWVVAILTLQQSLHIHGNRSIKDPKKTIDGFANPN